MASWYLNEGHVSTRQPRSAHYSVAPVQTFPTADGWIFIMCMTDKFFGELVHAICRPDLTSDARFGTPSSRQANRDALTDVIDAELSKQTNAHWLGKLGGVLPIAPVLDLAQALDNPLLRVTEMIRIVPHPSKPGMRALANPIKVDGKRLDQAVYSALGADNDLYLAEAPAQKRAALS